MKISGDKIELSELFTGLVLKSGKTELVVFERDGGFFIHFNGMEIRLVGESPIEIVPVSKSAKDVSIPVLDELITAIQEENKKNSIMELVEKMKGKVSNEELNKPNFKPAFIPSYTPYTPKINPDFSRFTHESLTKDALLRLDE